MNQIDGLIEQMPQPCQDWLAACRPALEQAAELRFRTGRHITAVCRDKLLFIGREGAQPSPGAGMPVVSREMLAEIVSALCEFSVYTHSESLRAGYLTIKGGHRIGLCAAMSPNGGAALDSISSINLRIANERIGCGEALAEIAAGRGLRSVLLCGPPLSGKTTVLRDCVRSLSDAPRYIQCALLDERGELAAMHGGRSPFRLGECTDVLERMDRRRAFEHALRTLSPQLIACDELGGAADLELLADCARSGVRVAATAHAASLADLKRRAGLWRTVEAGLFDSVVFLSPPPQIGALAGQYRVVG